MQDRLLRALWRRKTVKCPWKLRLLANGRDYFPGDINMLVNETRNMHIRWLDDFLEPYDLQQLQHNEHVLQGRADEVLIEFTEQHQVDLVVMGTVCRTGIPGFFIGNTAENYCTG